MKRRALRFAWVLAGLFYCLPFDQAVAQCTGQPSGNTVCASPSGGGAGLPTFRALVPADIPGGGGGGGSSGGPINAVQFNNPLGTFAGNSGFVYNSTSAALCTPNTVCLSIDQGHTIIDGSAWNAALTRFGYNVSSTGNQMGLLLEMQIAPTSSPGNYQKNAAMFVCQTHDPSTPTISRDCVGSDSRAYVAADNSNGHAWGGFDMALIQPGGEGGIIGREINVYNTASDNKTPQNGNTKSGIAVVSVGPNHSTAGYMVIGTVSKWHKGFWARGPIDLVDLATDPNASFIELESAAVSQSTPLFRVTPQGAVSSRVGGFSPPNLQAWDNSTSKFGATRNTANTSEIGLLSQITIAPTGSTGSHEKIAFMSECNTADASVIGGASYDCVGADMRGIIAAGNTNGHVWGTLSWASMGAGADGILKGHEIDVFNTGTDVAIFGAEKAKYGLAVISGGTVPITAGIYLANNVGAPMHKGFYAPAGSIVPTATDANSSFIEYAGAFRVSADGLVTVTTPTAITSTFQTSTHAGMTQFNVYSGTGAAGDTYDLAFDFVTTAGAPYQGAAVEAAQFGAAPSAMETGFRFNLTHGGAYIQGAFLTGGSFAPGSDNTMTLGQSALRWSTVYGATINGSDLVQTGVGSIQCNMNGTNATIGCSSSVSFLPQIQMLNTANDFTGPNWNSLKAHGAGGTVATNDQLGTFAFQGFANAANQTAAQIQVLVTGAPSGSNVPTQLKFQTSNTAGLLNQSMTLNSAAHLSFGQATAPTLSGGCSGAGSSITAGSTDVHGKLTGQTATATTCTVTFGTAFAAAPSCTVTSEIQAAGALSAAPATGSLVITWATATASMKLNWHCFGA